MAITRAQQARQMLEDGGMLVSNQVKMVKDQDIEVLRAQSGRTGGASRTGSSSARERGAERSRSSNRSSTSKTSSTGFGGGDDRREQESVTQTKTGTVKTSKTGPRTKVSQDTTQKKEKKILFMDKEEDIINNFYLEVNYLQWEVDLHLLQIN